MSRPDEKLLLRLLAGELDEVREKELQGSIAEDPELRATYRSLRAAWDGLEAPPIDPAPPDFRVRMMARVREAAERDSGVGWGAAPRWARGAAVGALLVGVVSGASLTRMTAPAPPVMDENLAVDLVTLAESYIDHMEADPGPADREVTP